MWSDASVRQGQPGQEELRRVTQGEDNCATATASTWDVYNGINSKPRDRNLYYVPAPSDPRRHALAMPALESI